MEILRAMKEKRFAKQAVKRLLKTRLATKADRISGGYAARL